MASRGGKMKITWDMDGWRVVKMGTKAHLAAILTDLGFGPVDTSSKRHAAYQRHSEEAPSSEDGSNFIWFLELWENLQSVKINDACMFLSSLADDMFKLSPSSAEAIFVLAQLHQRLQEAHQIKETDVVWSKFRGIEVYAHLALTLGDLDYPQPNASGSDSSRTGGPCGWLWSILDFTDAAASASVVIDDIAVHSPSPAAATCVLQQLQKRLHSACDFKIAEMVKLKLEDVKIREANCQEDELHWVKTESLLRIEKMLLQKLDEFDTRYDHADALFEEHAEALRSSLAARHAKLRQTQARQFASAAELRTPKLSKELLRKKHVQKILAALPPDGVNYAQAAKLKRDAENMEALECADWREAREPALEKLFGRVGNAQYLEMDGLESRIESERVARRLDREKRKVLILEKFQHLRELEMKKVETHHARKYQRSPSAGGRRRQRASSAGPRIEQGFGSPEHHWGARRRGQSTGAPDRLFYWGAPEKKQARPAAIKPFAFAPPRRPPPKSGQGTPTDSRVDRCPIEHFLNGPLMVRCWCGREHLDKHPTRLDCLRCLTCPFSTSLP